MEFEVREDAMAAQENMHNGELFGKVLSVNLARARNIDKNRAGTIFSSFNLTLGFSSAASALSNCSLTRSRECLYAVWESNPDEYYKVDEDGEGAEGQQPESADGMDTKA